MNYAAKRARTLTPYIAGEQPKDKKYIKLNTNENAYPPSDAIYSKIAAAAKTLSLYPDPLSCELCRAIASHEDLDTSYVFCGNGSDEVLSFCFYAFFDDDFPLLYPDITYSFYPVYAGFYSIPTKTVPLNKSFEIDIDNYLQPAGGVIFANPNAPTGIALSTDKICALVEYHKDKVVIVDEAYVAFGADSMAPFIRQYPNLIVVRTFSKSHSLAGMRIGYALGQPHLIDTLIAVKDSFNSYPVDRIACASAKAALEDVAYYREITQKIIDIRSSFSEAMQTLGFTVLPSKANFVFASHADIPAKDLFIKLKENGILVRYFNKPRIDNFLRITIGTAQEMDTLLETLKKLITV
jgi:histidinol-phosphate aminotransferase